MEPSQQPGTVDSFQVYGEALNPEAGHDLSCSHLLPPQEAPLLTPSERMEIQDSLGILDEPHSLELPQCPVEDFYDQVFPEQSEQSSGPQAARASGQEQEGASTPKEKEQEDKRMEVLEDSELKQGSEGELPESPLEESALPCTLALPECGRDALSLNVDALSTENRPEGPEEAGAAKEGVKEEPSVQGDLDQSGSAADGNLLQGGQPADTGAEEKTKEECGDGAAEGATDPQLSGAKLGTETEGKGLPAPSSPTGNATTSQNVKDTGDCHREPRLRRTESRAASQKSLSSDQLSDDDSDVMVDDPNDEDFVPHATPTSRRSARLPSRNQRTSDALHAVGQSSPYTGGCPSSQSRPARSQAAIQKPGQPPVQQQVPPRQPSKMHCANCHVPLTKGQTAYQRRGMPQLFCTSTCLSTYAKRPPKKKPCVFCKTDIAGLKETVFAQTGPSNSFQEFCNNICLSLYEAQCEKNALRVTSPVGQKCSMCHKVGEILHEVSSGNLVHRLCSDACFTQFRATKGLKTSCCDCCGLYIYTKTAHAEYLLHEGQQRRFCGPACLAQFKKKNAKVLPCQWCKTLCKNFDMLCKVDPHGKPLFFCSVCCITSYKVKTSCDSVSSWPCSFCHRTLSEPAYYLKTNQVIYQFCSPSCWTKFKSNTSDSDIQLNCHSCHNMFNGKPEILDWQGAIFQFCCKECCEDYKRLHGVVCICEHCKQEKLLHEKIKFSGVEKNFCSEGCILLYKQDFTKNLGLCCINCTYCSQTCTRAVTEELDGNTWDFCSEECKSRYLLWYLKQKEAENNSNQHSRSKESTLTPAVMQSAKLPEHLPTHTFVQVARCHACKRQGKLLETIHWRGEIKHYCDQKCLLRFYSQQNQPNLDTQQGPESLLNSESPESNSPPATAKKADATGKMQESQPSQQPPSPSSPTVPPVSITKKSVASQCNPMLKERSTTCKPKIKSQGCQTDDMMIPPFVLPVPVPVFIPVPLHMYCRYVPVPLGMPLPLPVPMFLPTTLENTDKIVEAIEELKVKIPSNPLEADILAMAEMIAEASEMDLVDNPSTGGLLEDCDLFESSRDDMLSMAVKMANVLDEPGQDFEAGLSKAPLDLTSEEFLLDCGIVTPDNVHSRNEHPVAVQKGSKRLRLTEGCTGNQAGSRPSGTQLNHTYGINAWKAWARTKQHVTEDRKKKRFKIKEDILSCSAAELNYGLAQFVKEISSPNGEHYEADSVYYMCLGIQQYLLENHRMVNIFTDQYYTSFVQELNKILNKWQPEVSPDGVILTDVEEEHLWDCKQLGVYSPFVLLNTLMYFNTKYFGMRTVEQHMELSFTNVLRQSRTTTTTRGPVKVHTVCYYPSLRHRKTKDSALGKRKREESAPAKEQHENRMNPLRCPVKFFEFYLSKCSGTVRNRSDLFYLQPERSCVAESPLWYSSVPVDRATLESMLNRILAVKEIYSDQAAEGYTD
ncbi:zinc finger MYM-type protein 3-like isoform X3 [Scleropages formosus]|uniref:zinc finger MYM-type protein 3-like isoform X3 n=1 Tax=Scleropages formosus TaxID=113540 RepID=UPI000878F6EE|nr:zinc finger MYM-type protein 3 isoform X3 [Scleropages formosus]